LINQLSATWSQKGTRVTETPPPMLQADYYFNFFELAAMEPTNGTG